MLNLKTILSAIIALVFLTVPISLVQARVSIKESTGFYKVWARNPTAVFQQIRHKGPRNKGRKHAIATTSVQLKVDRLKIVTKGRRCIVKNVRVRLKLVYKYPKWSNKNRSSRNSRKKWNVYFRQIVRHEKKHGAIAKSMARDIDRSVRQITVRASRNCSGINRKFHRVFKKLERRYERQQQVFDRKEHRRSSHIMKLERAFAYSK